MRPYDGERPPDIVILEGQWKVKYDRCGERHHVYADDYRDAVEHAAAVTADGDIYITYTEVYEPK